MRSDLKARASRLESREEREKRRELRNEKGGERREVNGLPAMVPVLESSRPLTNEVRPPAFSDHACDAVQRRETRDTVMRFLVIAIIPDSVSSMTTSDFRQSFENIPIPVKRNPERLRGDWGN